MVGSQYLRAAAATLLLTGMPTMAGCIDPAATVPAAPAAGAGTGATAKAAAEPGAEAKDSITCHILDTTAGRPAKGVRVSLQGPNNSTFQSTTGDDGRVNTWESAGEGGQKLDEILAASQGSEQWTLNFKTGEYFKDTTAFFPEATVAFVVEQGERYHVPLLLTPFSYTTYRGS
ncbi:hypothetical protein H634G_06276 [Metarhizium anisopliae BRIP 53293]|uniref:hydroxyisourate hydrolase n=1 Tax=Metarhizium anisopliae BRIP 53293 TaxID=1291518 RepID=A0A0D9NXN1_METAN|nr:hypothetical protein H634G_06276 [Metarhizium anisopliae BRIP 53293]KJK85890.1 hypothetical protein H633G_10263 [Metarhizium anisopliae BRIP 53284]